MRSASVGQGPILCSNKATSLIDVLSRRDAMVETAAQGAPIGRISTDHALALSPV
ncbi:MAG: hypothetical protein ACI9R3_004548 [Verrucomicrobiales bacterium]|jgi:hypothetical protein